MDYETGINHRYPIVDTDTSPKFLLPKDMFLDDLLEAVANGVYGAWEELTTRPEYKEAEDAVIEKADSYTPTSGMKTAAERALRWKKEGKATGAGTPVGWGRASDIVGGRSMSLDVVKRMYSFFSRHEVDKQGKDFDNISNPSNGRIMWDAWGGDSGFSWSRGIVERTKDDVAKFRADQARNRMGQFAPEGVGGGDGVREVTEFDFEESESKSPNNPGILDDKGVKFWVDGQFVGSRYQQVGNDILRHTMEGQLDLRLSPYAARYQGEVQGKAPRSDQEIAEMSTNLIVSLDAAKPAQPVLYRGMNKPTAGGDGSESQYQEILDLRVGDELATPMFSTTRNLDIAKMYSNYNSRGAENDTPVIFKIEAGSKGLKTSIVPMDAEVLSGGKYKVKDVVNLKYPAIQIGGSGVPQVGFKTARIITLEQVATFSAADIVDPSFTPDPEMAVDDFGWARGRR